MTYKIKFALAVLISFFIAVACSSQKNAKQEQSIQEETILTQNVDTSSKKESTIQQNTKQSDSDKKEKNSVTTDQSKKKKKIRKDISENPEKKKQNYNSNTKNSYRIGAICRDGTRSYATGRGACSHHGGVSYWLYK